MNKFAKIFVPIFGAVAVFGSGLMLAGCGCSSDKTEKINLSQFDTYLQEANLKFENGISVVGFNNQLKNGLDSEIDNSIKSESYFTKLDDKVAAINKNFNYVPATKGYESTPFASVVYYDGVAYNVQNGSKTKHTYDAVEISYLVNIYDNLYGTVHSLYADLDQTLSVTKTTKDKKVTFAFETTVQTIDYGAALPLNIKIVFNDNKVESVEYSQYMVQNEKLAFVKSTITNWGGIIERPEGWDSDYVEA